MNNETPSGCRIKELGLNIIAILVSINEYTKALDIVHLFDNDLLLITKKVIKKKILFLNYIIYFFRYMSETL